MLRNNDSIGALNDRGDDLGDLSNPFGQAVQECEMLEGGAYQAGEAAMADPYLDA